MIIKLEDLPALRKLYNDKKIVLGSYGSDGKSDARVHIGKGEQRLVFPLAA